MGISILDIAKANEVKKWIKKNELEFLQKSTRIIPTPDGKAIVRQEILLPSKEHADIFLKMYELADKADQFMRD